jgi:hypothetical protein
MYHQIQALFSALVVCKTKNKVYYIKNHIIKKELYVISIPLMDVIILKQNILYRILGIGTIVLQKKSGEKIIITSIKSASKTFKEISDIKSRSVLDY